MSRSDRREGRALLALVVIVVGAVIASAFSFIDSRLSQPVNQQETQNSAANEQGSHNAAAGISADNFDPWRENWAQWTMAIFAIVATGTGFVGLLWIRQTLDATRRGNKISRQVGVAQLRAYVGIQSVYPLEIEPHGKWIKVKVEFRNAGQTPALNFKTSTNIILEPSTYDGDWLSPQRTGSRGMILPGSPAFQTVELRDDNPSPEARLGPQDVHNLLKVDGGMSLWVSGKVTYADIFGKEHWTTFRYVLSKRPGLSAVFSPCAEGNETDD